KHEPITPERMRLEMVKALKPVDEAYVGYDGDPYKIVAEIKPDIIAIGYDQEHDPAKIERDLAARGIKAKVVRLSKHEGASDINGTRKIVGKIIEAYEFQKKMEILESKK
ncbi:MAG: FAD synthase, partial [Thermoplasmata archaeon HGW-Thermoplasmata-2]